MEAARTDQTVEGELVQWRLVIGYKTRSGETHEETFESTEHNSVAAFEDACRQLRHRAIHTIVRSAAHGSAVPYLDTVARIEHVTEREPWLITRSKVEQS